MGRTGSPMSSRKAPPTKNSTKPKHRKTGVRSLKSGCFSPRREVTSTGLERPRDQAPSTRKETWERGLELTGPGSLLLPTGTGTTVAHQGQPLVKPPPSDASTKTRASAHGRYTGRKAGQENGQSACWPVALGRALFLSTAENLNGLLCPPATSAPFRSLSFHLVASLST